MSPTEKTEGTQNYKKTPILVPLLVAGFIGLYFETSMNIALSSLIEYFNVGQSTIQWLTTGYLLTLGILVPVSALLSQWFTTRQLFIGSILFSLVGTIVAALAPSFSILLIARIIQAIGTAILLPLIINTILIIFPIEKRGSAMGLVGLVMLFAPAIGPSVIGVILNYLTWQWIFWGALPFSIFSLIFGMIHLPNITEVTKPKIDILSIILSTLGFGGVVFGFSSAGENGWGSPIVVISLIGGIVALTLFCIRQLKLKEPMIDIRVLKYPMYTLGIIIIFIVFMTNMGMMIVLPLYLQVALGLSTLIVGFVLLPGSLANGIASPFIGRLFDQVGPRVLIIPAFIVIMITVFGLSNLSTDNNIY
jgi:MFS transporter, DHA2 family, lincomycin resistance protein